MATEAELQSEKEYFALIAKKAEELKKEDDTKAKLMREQEMKQNYNALLDHLKKDMGYTAESKTKDEKTGMILTGNAIVDQTRKTFILRRQAQGLKYNGQTYEQMIKERVDGVI